jgi:hypothetical protein
MPNLNPMPTLVLKRRLPRFFISAALAALLAGSASAPPSRAAQEAAPLSLPFGRLLKCRLAFALEGARTPAPLIATVDEDLWWEGRKIVAAGSEVHGTLLKPSLVLPDRLEAADAFVLVTKGGPGERPAERPVQGQVLECEDACDPQNAPASGANEGTVGLKAHGPNARVDAGHAFYLYITREPSVG